jgi:hypothetical protein
MSLLIFSNCYILLNFLFKSNLAVHLNFDTLENYFSTFIFILDMGYFIYNFMIISKV